jgi:hypothetical protein
MVSSASSRKGEIKMTISPLENIERWRKWAEENRTAAHGDENTLHRQKLLDIAMTYDAMADEAELAIVESAR